MFENMYYLKLVIVPMQETFGPAKHLFFFQFLQFQWLRSEAHETEIGCLIKALGTSLSSFSYAPLFSNI